MSKTKNLKTQNPDLKFWLTSSFSEYDLLKGSKDPLIQDAISHGHYTKPEDEVALPRGILRYVGHVIIDSPYSKEYPWIGGPPPINMRELAVALKKAAVSKQERSMLAKRVKLELDEDGEINREREAH